MHNTFLLFVFKPVHFEFMFDVRFCSTFVGNTQHHLTVLRRLFSLFDNNNTECDKHTKSQGRPTPM